MIENKLNLTFEGPLINNHGVPFEDLMRTVSHVQRAIRLLIREFEGIDNTRGRPPQVVVAQSTLRLMATSKGSVTTEWQLAPPVGVQPHLNASGARAVQALFQRDNAGNSRLFEFARTELNEIGDSLSEDVDVVKMTSPSNITGVEFRRPTKKEIVTPTPKPNYETQLRGRLLEVNWDRCTAQLHRFADKFVRLTFDADLSDEMLRLATRHVEVRGKGGVDENDEWRVIEVDAITQTNSWAEPFDLHSILSDPNHKTFRRGEIFTASEPFDVEEFNRIIRDGRQDS